MEDDEDTPPFWLQSTTHHRRRRRQVSSFFLSSGVLLVLLLVVAFFLVFVIVPSFVSFTSQIFRPHLVKKSWDSLNLVLVIFAVVCGFLNINTNNSSHETPRRSYYRERSLSDNVRQDRTPRSYHETSPRWYDQFQQDRTPKLSRLRSFSSYPDLRQEASWISNDQRWRFYDDTHINNYRLSTSDQINPDPPLHRETKEPEVFEEVLGSTETKDIAVDTVVSGQDKEVVYSQPAQSSPPPAPPSPPPQSPSRHTPQSSKMVRRKVKRSYQDVEINYARVGENKLEEDKSFGIQPPSQAPPPPPPPPVYGKNEKRRGKDFLISLRRRKKKQRQKSVENLDAFFNLETSLPSLIPPPSPPLPPPPPPPPHFFQSIFSSKKGKTKKNQYINLAPPPPPPPPPPRTLARTRMEALASVSKPQIPPVITTQNPPKSLSTKSIEENTESGNASPLIPIPPPPPPPPFKIPAWKFLIEGDYVRVESFNSSRSGSPDIEENSDKESSPMTGGGEGAALPLFCPSPDVNAKADNFIARFKAGLRMEKINSVKGRSNLGLEGTSAETE